MRERYVDMLKGLSILCITFLHYENGVLPKNLNIFIGSFMISAFYVTSGWVSAMRSNKQSLKELVKKRWKQLGVPYLWWTLIILLFDFVLYAFGYFDLRYIGGEFYKAITLRGIGTLWFLPALFGGEVIWYWIKRQDNFWIIILALVVTACYNYYYGIFSSGKNEVFHRLVDAPFRTISNMLHAWVGIAFGYYSWIFLKKYLQKANTIIIMVMGSALCCFAYLTANHLPKSLSFCWGFLAPLFGPLGFLLLMKAFQKLKVLNILNFWGRNSLNLMVTHYSIILVMFTIVVEDILNHPFGGWVTILCFIISMPIQHILVSVVDKYFKFTLGK